MDNLIKTKEIRYLKSVADVSSLIIKSENITDALPKIVERLRTATEADICYVFLNEESEGKIFTTLAAESVKKGIKPRIENPAFQQIDYDQVGLSRWRKLLADGKEIIGKVDDFPKSEIKYLKSGSIQYIIVLPLISSKRWWGFIGFFSSILGNEWSDKEVSLLKQAANIVSLSLEKEEHLMKLRKLAREEGWNAGFCEAVEDLAHYTNNLLMGIMARSELIRRTSSEPETKERIEKITNLVEETGKIMEKFLDYIGMGLINKESFNLVEKIREIFEETRAKIGDLRNFYFHTDREEIIANADWKQLRKAISNIIENAIEATEKGGSIEIIIKEEGLRKSLREETPQQKYAKITIKDTGKGIPEEIMNKLFTPILSTSGRGLGLAQSYGIVKSHKGTIKAKTMKGRGSEFTIHLPLE